MGRGVAEKDAYTARAPEDKVFCPFQSCFYLSELSKQPLMAERNTIRYSMKTIMESCDYNQKVVTHSPYSIKK